MISWVLVLRIINTHADPPFQVPADQLVSKLKSLVDAAVDLAKRIRIRDLELLALSNAVAADLGAKMSAAQQSIVDAEAVLAKLTVESNARDTGRHLEVHQELLAIAIKVKLP